ncbi:MAG: hypothetical protein ACPLKZ_06150 [Candidatus Bathyarchaeales archaeon]
MKLVKFLDQKGTVLVSDPLNQTILKNLVMSEYSISELSAKLNLPTLKLWRRMQALLKANLVELCRTVKIGNIEKKLYRATATGYVPQQYFDFKPKDANLQEAFKIYSDIQKRIMLRLAAFGDVPKEADPVDFALFANMQAFTQTCVETATHAKLAELEKKLAEYHLHNHH